MEREKERERERDSVFIRIITRRLPVHRFSSPIAGDIVSVPKNRKPM